MEREKLKGGSYKESRELFEKRGTWTLPTGIPKSRFREIAYLVMVKLMSEDKDNLFAKPNIWTRLLLNPMHSSMIIHNIREGLYEGWTDPVLPFFEDILRLFDYHSLFDIIHNISDRAEHKKPEPKVIAKFARMFALMPEFFAKACVSTGLPQLCTSKKKKKE